MVAHMLRISLKTAEEWYPVSAETERHFIAVSRLHNPTLQYHGRSRSSEVQPICPAAQLRNISMTFSHELSKYSILSQNDESPLHVGEIISTFS